MTRKGVKIHARKLTVPWYRSPVKLFGYTGLLLFLVRVLYPPADFAGAFHVHSYMRFLDFRLDLTGYGLFEFVAVVFLASSLIYYLMLRLSNRQPKSSIVQLHFWPSLLFALFSIFLAHWVNHLTSTEVDDPTFHATLNNWLSAFNWIFVVFLVFQIVFAIGAVRSIWQNRNAVV